MKKKTVYLLKIQPKGYANSIELSFSFVPTAEEVVKVLDDMSTNTKREELKQLCKKCTAGLNIWGMPKVIDNQGSYVHWKSKGESMYSSKGITAIKPFVCYSK